MEISNRSGLLDYSWTIGFMCLVILATELTNAPTQAVSTVCTNEGDVRFANNSLQSNSPFEAVGHVEICYSGNWGGVCGANSWEAWDVRDAYVFCKQLGYHRGTNSSLGPWDGGTLATEFRCDGDENGWPACAGSFLGQPVDTCPADAKAAVECFMDADPLPAGSLRLAENVSEPCYTEGRLEVYHVGEWGTVCDVGFDVTSAVIACTQMGYTVSGTVLSSAATGGGTGWIWLIGVQCLGTEARLVECPHDPWGQDTLCSHSEDVNIRCNRTCSDTTTSSTTTTTTEPVTTTTISATTTETVTTTTKPATTTTRLVTTTTKPETTTQLEITTTQPATTTNKQATTTTPRTTPTTTQTTSTTLLATTTTKQATTTTPLATTTTKQATTTTPLATTATKQATTTTPLATTTTKQVMTTTEIDNTTTCSASSPNTCLHNGTCIDESSSYRCRCTGGYAGTQCQTPITSRPVVHTVTPQRGPIAGGTNVVITGSHLNIFHLEHVFVGDRQCDLKNYTHGTIEVVTPAANVTFVDRHYPFRLEYAGELVIESNANFLYKANPEVQNIHPTETLRRGGTTLTVDGVSMDSVAHPYIEITMLRRVKWRLPDGNIAFNESKTIFQEVCNVTSTTRVVCRTPRLQVDESFLWNATNTMRRKRSSFNLYVDERVSRWKSTSYARTKFGSGGEEKSNLKSQTDIAHGRRRRETSSQINYKSNNFDLIFALGFLMDGYNKYKNLSDTPELQKFGELDVYAKRSITPFDETLNFWSGINTTLDILGEEMDRGCSKDDYIIDLGAAQCVVVELHSNVVKCRPPNDEPDPGAFAHPKGLSVVVHVGTEYSAHVGYLRYRYDNTIKIVSGTVTGAVVIVGLLLFLVVTYKRKIQRVTNGGEPATPKTLEDDSSDLDIRTVNSYYLGPQSDAPNDRSRQRMPLYRNQYNYDENSSLTGGYLPPIHGLPRNDGYLHTTGDQSTLSRGDFTQHVRPTSGRGWITSASLFSSVNTSNSRFRAGDIDRVLFDDFDYDNAAPSRVGHGVHPTEWAQNPQQSSAMPEPNPEEQPDIPGVFVQPGRLHLGLGKWQRPVSITRGDTSRDVVELGQLGYQSSLKRHQRTTRQRKATINHVNVNNNQDILRIPAAAEPQGVDTLQKPDQRDNLVVGEGNYDPVFDRSSKLWNY